MSGVQRDLNYSGWSDFNGPHRTGLRSCPNCRRVPNSGMTPIQMLCHISAEL
jgi:hypothetical protein